MKADLQNKLDKIHNGIIAKNNGEVRLLTIIYVANNFINYYINQGKILEEDRNECYKYIAYKVYHKYNCTLPLAAEGWIDMMKDYKEVDSNTIEKYKIYVDSI